MGRQDPRCQGTHTEQGRPHGGTRARERGTGDADWEHRRSARPSQLHFLFFSLLAKERVWVAEAERDGRRRGRGNVEKQRAAPRDLSGFGTPLGSPPPLRPTRSGAASLGEVGAGRPPGADSSLARFGDPGHPQWLPLTAPALSTRLSGLVRSLTINNVGNSFVWAVWKVGRKWGSRGESGGTERHRMTQ